MNITLPPLISPDCRVLILGSHPSLISIRNKEYYANPRNMFWDIFGTIFNIPRELPYHDRISLILSSGIGIWDVYASCNRQNSADAKITCPVPNDITAIIESRPHIRAIFLNGREAERGFRLFFPDITINSHYLPSSSPAHAIPLKEKIECWREITKYLTNIS